MGKKPDHKNVRSYNVGDSNYSKYQCQPWTIWNEYKLDPFRADIVKRVLRTKSNYDERLDIEKIIHICQEILRQMDEGTWDEWKR
jgi:hypothetical protein